LQTIPVDRIYDLEKGDHIKFHRLAFTHHAIVTDVFPDRDEFEVIEMGLTLDQKPKVGLKRSMKRMSKWRKRIPVIYKYHYEGVDRLSPEKTVAVIEILLQKREKIQYNLFFNNCEHIATFCVTGVHRSEQVLRAVTATASAIAAVLLRIGLLLL
jgi:hypothetical protein